MHGLERPGILDPQARQRVHVEETAVVDVAGGEPPMAKLVVLALEQMVQCKRLRRTVGAAAIGGESACDDVRSVSDVLQLRLEGWRLLAIGVTQSGIARGEREQACARLAF